MTTPGAAPTALGRTGWMAAGLLTIAIIGLHTWLLLHAGAFCGDEVNVINLAHTHSLSVMTHDSFPVLLPLLVGGWTAMGLANTDLSLRLLGLLFGLGLLGSLWLASWAGRRAPPLLSLIIFGLSAPAIYWTDYLRAYGLGSMLIVLTLAAVCFLFAAPSWWRTLLVTILAALSVQALFQDAVFVAAMAFGGWAVCWMRKDKATAIKILGASVAAALSIVPYLTSVLRWQHATTIRPGFSFTAALDNLHTMLAFPLPQSVWLWAGLSVAVIALALMLRSRLMNTALQPGVGGIVRLRSGTSFQPAGSMSPSELPAFAAVTLVSSVVGYLVFLHFAALITSPWYFLPLMAIAAVCFDLGISLSALPRLFRTVAWGILIGTAGVSVPFAVRDLNCRFSNMDLVVSRISEEASPEDYILVTPWHLGISFNHYYHGDASWDTLPPVADHSTYRWDLLPATTEDASRRLQPVLDRIAKTLQAGHRVWVVGWMRVPAPGRTASTVEGRFLVSHSEKFEPVNLKIKGQTSDYENVSLLLADGWRPDSS